MERILPDCDLSTGLPVASNRKRVASGTFTPDEILACVQQSLDDDKAENIVQIDLRGRSSMADYMVICSGRSARQVAAIADKLIERLKARFAITPRPEGREAADWVLIDAGDVVIHVFRPEVREFYQLEKIWLPADELTGDSLRRESGDIR